MHRSLIEAGAGRRTAHLTGPSLDRNISNELGRQGHTGKARSCHGSRWFYAYADLQALGAALPGRPGSGNVQKSGNPARIEATPVSSESFQMYQASALYYGGFVSD